MSRRFDVKIASKTPLPESWVEEAACLGSRRDLFFAEDSKLAKKLCWGCVVRGECLSYAMRTPALRGVWGGESEQEREARLRGGAKVQEPRFSLLEHVKQLRSTPGCWAKVATWSSAGGASSALQRLRRELKDFEFVVKEKDGSSSMWARNVQE